MSYECIDKGNNYRFVLGNHRAVSEFIELDFQRAPCGNFYVSQKRGRFIGETDVLYIFHLRKFYDGERCGYVSCDDTTNFKLLKIRCSGEYSEGVRQTVAVVDYYGMKMSHP